MLVFRSILVTTVALLAGTTLQGCYPFNDDDTCDGAGNEMQLEINPTENVYCVDCNLATLSELVVESMIVSLQGQKGSTRVKHDTCVSASVETGSVHNHPNGQEQYLQLSLTSVSTKTDLPNATVYGVPMHQILARSGAIVHAECELFGYHGDAGPPLKIQATEGSQVTLRNTHPGNVNRIYILADSGAKIDLGALTTDPGAQISISASNGAHVTGNLTGSIDINCRYGGVITVSRKLSDGRVENLACGEKLFLAR